MISCGPGDVVQFLMKKDHGLEDFVNVSKNEVTENHMDQKSQVENEPDVDKYFEEYIQEHGGYPGMRQQHYQCIQ